MLKGKFGCSKARWSSASAAGLRSGRLSGIRSSRAGHSPQRPDWLAGHVRFELRNVVANYPFESSCGFPGSEPNSGQGDHSRLSCSAGIRSSGLGSAGVFSKRSTRTLAIMRRRREGTSAARGTAALRAALRPLLIGSRRARVARRSACGSPRPDPLQSGEHSGSAP